MVCLLSIENGEIKGWILADDIDDARRQAQMAGRTELATLLYRMPSFPPPPPGKYNLPTGEILLIG